MHTFLKNDMGRILLAVLIAGLILPFPASGTPVSAAGASVPAASFMLDNVNLTVASASLPPANFLTSQPGAINQVATSTQLHPFREFSITAVPLGYQPGTEALPVAQHGSKAVYDLALGAFRRQQGASVQDGPIVSLFGQRITGLTSLVRLPVDGPTPRPVEIEEWVVEAGARIWIVRASEERGSTSLPDPWTSPFQDLNVSSAALSNPTTIGSPQSGYPGINLPSRITTADLPVPPWWNGDCDSTNYLKKSGGISSHPLGATYLGLVACGPRPIGDHGPDVLVNFFPGAWGEYEWECLELVMRFLYLNYGINPYKANGSQAVWNYSGSRLTKISNGTTGQGPQPNDVLSYGSTSTFGHASVVTSSNVDGSGNGTVTVIEENNSASGTSTLSIKNWWVSGNAGSVSGWLHDATGGSPPPTFSDVPTGYWAYASIESLYKAGITGGCSTNPLMYCPEASVTRGQMAVFLEKGLNGPAYLPPAATGTVFADVSKTYWAASWIEKLAADGIATGCATGLYCPDNPVTRAQMAVFLLKSEHGSAYSPPPAAGTVFTDVPASYWPAAWIEQLASEGISSGCGGGLYCPDQAVTRAQMAVFLVKTFHLP